MKFGQNKSTTPDFSREWLTIKNFFFQDMTIIGKLAKVNLSLKTLTPVHNFISRVIYRLFCFI